MAEGKEADILFWVGSAGSFDDRAKKITNSTSTTATQDDSDWEEIDTN